VDAQVDRRRSRSPQARTGISGEHRRGLQLPREPSRPEDIKDGNDNILTIAREARLLAGFTEDEIERLVAAARKSAAY